MTTKKEPLMSKFKSKGKERYVMLRYWLLNSAAWNSLPGNARALYIEITQRYNGSNNGRISFSVGEAMQALGVSKGQAKYLFDMLLDRGFIICTRRGAFSLKTVKDASEWLLTEYASDHPPTYATKAFMHWNGDFESVSQFRGRKGERRPKMTDADKERASRFENKTRFTAMNHTVHSHEPHGSQPKTVKPKKRQNGSQPKTVNAQNSPLTVHSHEHLQLPGIGREPGDLLPSPELAAKKPWSTPTVEEVPWDALPTEMRMLVLGLPDAGLPPQVGAVPDVPDVPDQAEPRSPVDHYAPGGLMDHEQLRDHEARMAAAKAAKQEADQRATVAAQPRASLVLEAIVPDVVVPAQKPMLPGDRRRAEILARNREAQQRFDAEIKERLR
jgi:hypothetical protein